MLRRTLPALLVALVAAGCDQDRTMPARPTVPTRPFCEETLGVCVEVPAHWLATVDGAALAFAGQCGTDDFYTVLSLQGVADPGLPLERVLDETWAEFATSRRFRWLGREPRVVAGRPALAYGLELDLDESIRRRVGLLVAGDGLLVDLAYSAVPALFWRNLAVFLAAEDSLVVTGGDPPLASERDW